MPSSVFSTVRFAALLATLAVVPAGLLDAQELTPNAKRELQAIFAEKAARTPAQRKIATSLLYAHRQSKGETMVQGLGRPLARVAARAGVDAQGMVLVQLRAEVTDDLLSAITDLGGEVLSYQPGYGSVSARLPIRRIEDLAERPEVRQIGPPDRFLLNTGSATTQGDVAHAAATARTTFGINGTGVKVGVLSDGVNTRAARQATGDLPAGLVVVPGQAGNGDEGTAMLEIVHDLAPGAQLFFASAVPNPAAPTPADFAANILTLRNTYGCDIIIDDVTFFSEGAFQDGIIAQAVNTVTTAGALHFSSAGNSGNLNDGTSGTWEGDFVNSGMSIPVIDSFEGQPVLIHRFGAVNNNTLTMNAPTAISLKWSDPLGASNNDYDIFLLNATLNTIFDASAAFQTGTQDPFEIMGFGFTGERVVVALYSGAGRALRVDTHRGRLSIATSGSVFGHNGAGSALSTAAVNVASAGGGVFTGGPANPVEIYSSDGPRRIFYNPAGAAITPGNVLFGTNGGQNLQKPDLTAADCVITTTPGFNPFCGTSAAAPHAGGIAALLKSISTRPSGGQVAAAMVATALDIEAVGRDRDSGAGIVMANSAANALTNIPAAQFFTVSPCRVVDTRNPPGPYGGPALTCGIERNFTITGQCGIPPGAKAVSLNATVALATGGGNLRLFGAGAPAPTVSALNWSAGVTRGNNGIIPLNASGALTALCGPVGPVTTQLIIDVNGYFQ